MLFITHTTLAKTKTSEIVKNQFTKQGELTNKITSDTLFDLLRANPTYTSDYRFEKELLNLFDKEIDPDFHTELCGSINIESPWEDNMLELFYRKTSSGNTTLLLKSNECYSHDVDEDDEVEPDENYYTLIYSGTRGRLAEELRELPEEFKCVSDIHYSESAMPVELQAILNPWDGLQDLPRYKHVDGYKEAIRFLRDDVLTKLRNGSHEIVAGFVSFEVKVVEGIVDRQTEVAASVSISQLELGKLYGIQESIKLLKKEYNEFVL